MPMDYRVPLFQLMAQRHEVRFFFMRASSAYAAVAAAYASSGQLRFGLRPGVMSRGDARAIRDGVRGSDVFVTSFVLNAFSIWGALCARLAGKKVVVWEEMYWFAPDSPRAQLRRLATRVLARLADAFFVMGEPQRAALVGMGIAPARIFVANEYPGRDYALVPPRPIALAAGPARPVLLFLGRLVEVKGVDYLLRAFAVVERRRPDAALVIAGDGPQRAELQALAADLGIRSVEFIGLVSDPGIKSALLRRASAMVVPSVRTRGIAEGGPLVVLEALSAGLPVIGSDALGSSTDKIIEGVSGKVVPERDFGALADAMVDMLARPVDRARVRAAFLELPDHAHQAARLEDAIACALGAHGHAR